MDSGMKLLGDLFDQQRQLNAEQLRVTQDLVHVNQKIQYLLSVHAHGASNGTSKIAIEGPVRRDKVMNGLRKKASRHAWFERGEAVKLIQKVARRPMRPAQIVHAIMDAKGYASTLAGDDKRRAQSAIHQAVISAVKAGALTRNQAGAVRAKA
jgi:hypothetical protein